MSIKLNITKNLGTFSMNINIETKSKRIGILGQSGMGKSMCLKMISGLETPDNGEIYIDEKCVFSSTQNINILPQNRKTGYMFQNYALFPNMTVEKNIAIAIEGNKSQKKEITKKIIEKFSLLGLEKKYPSQLSGGQQQRVSLARIFAYNPEMILLDEPFSALDKFLKENLIEEMKKYIDGYDGTIILVSHNTEEIFALCDYVFVIHNGSVADMGNIDEIFKKPKSIHTARLSGCKNIWQAKKKNNNTIFVPELNAEFKVSDTVPDNVEFIGIHEKDVVIKKEDSNSFLCVFSETQKGMFENTYVFTVNNKNVYVKTSINQEFKEGKKAYIYLPEEKIFVIKKQE